MPSDTFEFNISTDPGNPSDGNASYLWSNPSNWSTGHTPANGGTITTPPYGFETDDLAGLSLSTVIQPFGGDILVTGDLTVGSFLPGSVPYLEAMGQTATVTVLNDLASGGAYSVEEGTVIFTGAPAANSALTFLDGGTFVLKNPGAVISAVLDFAPDNVPGFMYPDVIELPGGSVNFVNFSTSSLTIATNQGVFDFATTALNGTIGADPSLTGYAAHYDPATGLEAITFLQTDVFEFNTASTSGSLAGDDLWSDPGNWSLNAVPVDGQAIAISANPNASAADTYDDLGPLSLGSVTELAGNTHLYVTNADLTIGTLIGGLSDLNVDPAGEAMSDTFSSINTPITLAISSFAGSGPIYLNVYGNGSAITDESATETGEVGEIGAGARLQLLGPIPAGRLLAFEGRGTLALNNPGSTIAGTLEDLGRDDVIELPGSAVDFVHIGESSVTIATNLDSYSFQNVGYAGNLSADDARFDPATGLEAITFRGVGPDEFQAVTTATTGPAPPGYYGLDGGYLWSEVDNWTDGEPLSGDALTVGATSVDDLASLSLPSLTLASGGNMFVVGGDLDIGTLVNAGPASILEASSELVPVSAGVVLTLESSEGPGGAIGAQGARATVIDNAAQENALLYAAESFGTLVLAGTPQAGSDFFMQYGGTLALQSVASGPVAGNFYVVGSGDVLELPGTSASTVVLGPANALGVSTATIITSAGSFSFGDIVLDTGLTAGIANFDTASGLEAITFGATVLENPSISQGESVLLGVGTVFSDPVIDGGTLDLGFGGSLEGDISFSGTGGELVIETDDDGATTAPQNTIIGFTLGDSIKFADIPFLGTGDSFGTAGEDTYTVASAGTLTIDAAGAFYDLLIAGTTIGQDNFSLSGDLRIKEAALCFLRGTRIAVPGGEVAVERLRIGDAVATQSGPRRVRFIGRRSYDGRFAARNHLVLPVCIRAGAIGVGVPKRDLWVSPGHGILVGGALAPAWRLVNGGSISQPRRASAVQYYHIEFETHEIILAEGCPAESFLDARSRNQFQNSAEFYTRHADDPGSGRTPCFARVEHGFTLQAIQHRLAVRSAVKRLEHPFGPLRGYVDQAVPGSVSGWAQHAGQPEVPVVLDVLVNGRRASRVLANGYRGDLRAAGLGSGCHGFEVHLPGMAAGRVEVRRTVDQLPLMFTQTAQASAA